MSVSTLANAMSGLSVSTNRPQNLSRNGICGCSRLQISTPRQAAVSVSTETVCGKIKTRKAVAKRFKISGSGKILRRRPGKQHINEKMSRAKLRKLGKTAVVEKRDIPLVAPNLPYSGVRQSKN